MKLSISNIGWAAEDDEIVFQMMNDVGFMGLEIAPTRIFPDNPYDKCGEAKKWVSKLYQNKGFKISSMQSIWYGRKEMLFGSDEERQELVDYTKKAIDFAEVVGCGNLVFGCPRNRSIPEYADEQVAEIFFKEIGDYAVEHGTVVAMEANPPIYNTNYINDTLSAIDLIKRVDSKGFLLNLDLGTMIENREDVSIINGNEQFINHVHISEPRLKLIEERKLHQDLSKLLIEFGYEKYISIEVGKQDNVQVLGETMNYVKSIFGEV